jgi:hypothetical protein
MMTRKKIILTVSICAFVTGAILLGVGSAGTATPLIVAGVILIMVSGAGGFMGSFEQEHRAPISRINANAAATAA